MADIRNSNFKVGTFHGSLNPVKGSKEASLRNALYLIGMIKLPYSSVDILKIRLFAYEVPIGIRGKRIDLLGYDENKNPWIIELKAHDSGEHISKIVDQINNYEKQLRDLLPHIELEFEERFLLPIEFSKVIKKMILAPREFYLKEDKTKYPKKKDILLCSIAKLKEVYNKDNRMVLDEKFSVLDQITVKIENRDR
ncbi:MAG: hypothetical protein K9N07_11765 [Candidatus Cloacimonetes bacterium]|nr:hypothetical protein [Candidatus Cloacimonadota bacterium]